MGPVCEFAISTAEAEKPSLSVKMKAHRFRTGLLLASLAVSAAAGQALESPTGPGGDPLEGRWQVYEGRLDSKDGGIYFESKGATAVGSADFREWQGAHKANFEKASAAACETIPWGAFEYSFEPSGC